MKHTKDPGLSRRLVVLSGRGRGVVWTRAKIYTEVKGARELRVMEKKEL
jgi:hypothetical protein